MSIFSNEINALSVELLEKCKAKNIRLATAESCTGGLIAAALTEIAGSSAVVDRGFVTYSNEAKMEMLGVKATTLAAHGAVSKEVALEMAAGALKNSHAALSVSVTGIAGPDGGSAHKPVGLVHIAVSYGSNAFHKKHMFGSILRSDIRLKTVHAALLLCLGIVSKN